MKDAKGFDATAFAARSGFVSAIPQANAHYEPGNSPIAFGDWNTGCALTAGILGAYAGALRTGVGDKVTGSVSCWHWGMTSALIAQQQGCDYPKDRMEAKCPTNNSLCIFRRHLVPHSASATTTKYCKLVFDTLEMDPKYYTEEQYNTLEALADNGK